MTHIHPDQKIHFAVIGCGHIGKRHATMVSRNPDCGLTAICDINADQMSELKDFNVPVYTDPVQMLQAHPEIDIVSVCTPNGLHAQHALLALDHHKHVVCEKPMGLKRSECEEIIYRSLNVSKQVFCVMQNRYSPPSVWIRELTQQQILGDIAMVQINCYWNRDDRYYLKDGRLHDWKGWLDLDGGTLFTQFSHFIDIMYWLFGDITNIKAQFADFQHQHTTEFEDSGTVHFEFVNGGLGCLNFSTAVFDTNLESSMTIIGTNGSVKIGGQYMNEVEYCNIRDYEMPKLPPANPANDYGAYKGSANNHGFIFENVVNVLKHRHAATTNALEGMKVVDIIERIYAAGERPIKKLKR